MLTLVDNVVGGATDADDDDLVVLDCDAAEELAGMVATDELGGFVAAPHTN